jgi:hypothetical protein
MFYLDPNPLGINHYPQKTMMSEEEKHQRALRGSEQAAARVYHEYMKLEGEKNKNKRVDSFREPRLLQGPERIQKASRKDTQNGLVEGPASWAATGMQSHDYALEPDNHLRPKKAAYNPPPTGAGLGNGPGETGYKPPQIGTKLRNNHTNRPYPKSTADNPQRTSTGRGGGPTYDYPPEEFASNSQSTGTRRRNDPSYHYPPKEAAYNGSLTSTAFGSSISVPPARRQTSNTARRH